jgi:hypothetical protein
MARAFARQHQVDWGRRLTMLDLVLWSFIVALTPVALSLAWSLISWIGDGTGSCRDFAFLRSSVGEHRGPCQAQTDCRASGRGP